MNNHHKSKNVNVPNNDIWEDYKKMNDSDVDTEDEFELTEADLDRQLAEAQYNIAITQAIIAQERMLFENKRYEEALLNHFKVSPHFNNNAANGVYRSRRKSV